MLGGLQCHVKAGVLRRDPLVQFCKSGTYPLHEAVKQDQASMVRWLLHFGADPGKKDGRGRVISTLRYSQTVLGVFFFRCRLRVVVGTAIAVVSTAVAIVLRPTGAQ